MTKTCNHPQSILELTQQIDDTNLAKIIHCYLNEHCDQMNFRDKLNQIINEHESSKENLAFSILAFMAVTSYCQAE